MVKKVLRYFLFLLLAAALVKGFFFSGTARPPHPVPAFKKHHQPGWVWVSAGSHYQRGGLGKLFLGRHYREVWSVPVPAPIMDFSKVQGGLQVGKMGGGMQTTSLNLTDPQGRTWVLRSLDKDPVGVLSPFWQRTVAADLVRDQISAANPYAALVVAPLAERADIPHTNPRIVFVPAGGPVRPYQDRLGNRLFLLEEKYTNHFLAHFSSGTGIFDSVEMLDQRFRSSACQIDQESFARCRLFDMLIGDWDRHEGQWNWVAFPRPAGILFKPIPKDRDQAFSRYRDGIIPWLLTRDFAFRKFAQFNQSLAEVEPYTINGAFLDERALNALELKDFERIARELMAALPDPVIEDAVKHFPTPVYRLIGRETVENLKSRRRQLLKAARAYYRLLARQVIVAGSDERELFRVDRLDDERTLVQVFRLNAGNRPGPLIYRRLFKTQETKSLVLHGLAGNDRFKLSGEVAAGIKISIVGGLGEDQIQNDSVVRAADHKTVVLDTRRGTKITGRGETQDKTTDDISVHNFDREGY